KQWRKAPSCAVEAVASGCGARRANPLREARSGVYIAVVCFFSTRERRMREKM
ncbi:hypothetical protein A2U01_0088574, partial [Trifolium medium]|nr:hypothetical protein [Trifolium medium]